MSAVLSLVLSLGIGLSGCSQSETIDSAVKTVSVVQADAGTFSVGLDYIGVVQPKETSNYAFLSGGKIAEIYVEEGQQIKKGQLLAKLDTTQLEISASMSANSLQIAQVTLDQISATYDTNIQNTQHTIDTLTESLKASQAALETAQLNLERYETLYEIGGVSETEMENMRLQVSSQQASYTQLQNELASAQTTLENLKISREQDLLSAQASASSSSLAQQQAEQNLNDATLTADRDGIIMEIPYKEGEVVGAGYPVVITKSQELMVAVGVSVEDYGKISKDCSVLINGEIRGTIDTISPYPDLNTRTYEVDILFEAQDLSAGDTVDVSISVGQEEGVLVPIESIFQVDGLDYVYVVNEENRVNKQQVTLGEPRGSSVRVSGLDSNARVVTNGAKLLNENEIVSIDDGMETGEEA